MKKFRLLILALALVPAAVFAQGNASKSPSAGNWMLELNANPFGSEGVFSSPGLQVKYRITNRLVARLAVDADWRKNGVSPSDYREDEKYKNVYSEKTSMFSIRPGVEFHFLKGTKVSPYAGLEVAYRKKSSSSWYEAYNVDYYDKNKLNFSTHKEIDGSWVLTTGSSYSTVTTYPERAFNSIGLNLVLGSDFYLVKNMYFGFEVGLGYSKIDFKRVEQVYEYYYEYDKSTSTTTSTLQPSSSPANLSFYSNSAIRFGVWF